MTAEKTLQEFEIVEEILKLLNKLNMIQILGILEFCKIHSVEIMNKNLQQKEIKNDS